MTGNSEFTLLKKAFELALALTVSSAAWLWLFPALGATSGSLSALTLVLAVLAYAVLLANLGELFVPAEMLIGARFNANVVFWGLMASQVVTPYAAIALAGVFVPGLVVSYAWLAPSVVLGFIAYYIMGAQTGPIREYLDKYQILKNVTLLVTVDGVFVPKIKGGELVRGGLYVVDPVLLNAADEDVRRALHKGVAGDWETADMLMLRAIPELAGCHALGLHRLRAACTVMKQSMLAVGSEEEAQEYQRFDDTLQLLFEQECARMGVTSERPPNW